MADSPLRWYDWLPVVGFVDIVRRREEFGQWHDYLEGHVCKGSLLTRTDWDALGGIKH